MSNPDPSGAILLGIDTSGAEGSLALARIDGVNTASVAAKLLSQRMLHGRSCSAELIPRLRELFSEAVVTVSNVAAIVVVTGPGSFTGLRIGISAAKAFAEAGSIPVIAISRLALLSSVAENVAPVLDAGRGEYYVRLPGANGELAVELLEAEAALLDALKGRKVCICEPVLEDRLASLAPLLVPPPSAIDAISAALPRFLAQQFDDVASLDANYLRRPYAQLATATE